MRTAKMPAISSSGSIPQRETIKIYMLPCIIFKNLCTDVKILTDLFIICLLTTLFYNYVHCPESSRGGQFINLISNYNSFNSNSSFTCNSSSSSSFSSSSSSCRLAVSILLASGYTEITFACLIVLG